MPFRMVKCDDTSPVVVDDLVNDVYAQVARGIPTYVSESFGRWVST